MPERRYATPKKRVVYRIGVHTLPDSFCAATKIITNKASVHIQEQLYSCTVVQEQLLCVE